MTAQLNHHEWEMLSAYIDGRGSRAERERIERWIAEDITARDALNALEDTRVVFRALRKHKVPRNFTLTREMIKPPAWFPAFTILRISSALAAAALAVLLVAGNYPFLVSSHQQQASVSAQMPSAILRKEAGPGGPMIINWGGSPSSGAYGKGGGGGDATDLGIGGGEAAQPAIEPAIAAPVLEGDAEKPPSSMSSIHEITLTPLEGFDPLLGIRPSEERGTIIGTRPGFNDEIRQTTETNIWTLVALGTFTVCSAIAALILRQRLPAWLRAR